MRVFRATGLLYRINIVSGGEGVYILSGVKEKRQESEINTIVWVFQLLLAGIVPLVKVANEFVEKASKSQKRILFVYRERFKDPIASTTGQRS